jgi:hypothetical protein
MAVWLIYDDYDYDHNPRVISATTLLKSTKQIVLARKYKDLNKTIELSGLVNARMGTAIHSGVELAWSNRANVDKALTALGYGSIIDKVLVNPEPDEIKDTSICVYVEQRVKKEINGYTISGKFDLVINGRVIDIKSTSVWTHIFGSNDSKYIQQGSIYRWANPDKITDDIMQIEFVFTDWSSSKAKQDPRSYPQDRVLIKELALMSEAETNTFILNKTNQITKYMTVEDSKLPDCTGYGTESNELWEKPTEWKYYKDPSKKTKSTKNFDNYPEAKRRLLADGNVGELVEIPGEVVACRYCSVSGICDQYQRLKAVGKVKV